MVEFPLRWVIVLAGAFLALAVGFGTILVFLLIQRSNQNKPKDQETSSSKKFNLMDMIDEHLIRRKSSQPATIVAPPAQGEEGKNWVLLYRQPESERLTISLPGKEIVLKPEEMTPMQLMQVKSMALGLQHWLGLSLSQPVEKPAAPIPPVPIVARSTDSSALPPMLEMQPSEPMKSNPMSRSIFFRREAPEIKPMVSMAVQINTYLQNILLQENYTGQDLYLTDNEQGDLVVVLGVEKFIGLDAVPDPEIAALIKRAADQWTKHQLRHG